MDERRHELIERYRAGRKTLAEAVAAHPDARHGEWGGREVLMHVIGWDREAAASLPRLAAGEPSADYTDENAWNRVFVERFGGLTDGELAREYEASEAALVEVLEALPDESFAEGRPGANWAAELADHALDHAASFGDIGA